MKCPVCNFQDSRVLDSRPVEDGASIKRRRECTSCGKRFTTYEVIDTVPIAVVKRNGQAVKFNEYSTFFTVDKDGEYEVKYNYFPTIEDGIELDLPPRFTTHILGLGIAGEYCFRKGLIDEAEDFRRRFLTALTNVTNTKKSYKIKVVR